MATTSPENSATKQPQPLKQLPGHLARLSTFAEWLHSHSSLLAPENMAMAGFSRLLPNECGSRRLGGDWVRCTSCGIYVHDWEPEDVPLKYHLQHCKSPCSYLVDFRAANPGVLEQYENEHDKTLQQKQALQHEKVIQHGQEISRKERLRHVKEIEKRIGCSLPKDVSSDWEFTTPTSKPMTQAAQKLLHEKRLWFQQKQELEKKMECSPPNSASSTQKHKHDSLAEQVKRSESPATTPTPKTTKGPASPPSTHALRMLLAHCSTPQESTATAAKATPSVQPTKPVPVPTKVPIHHFFAPKRNLRAQRDGKSEDKPVHEGADTSMKVAEETKAEMEDWVELGFEGEEKDGWIEV